MNDTREDQLLCPSCYVPVESTTGYYRDLIMYICPNCPNKYTAAQLVSANQLSRDIDNGLEKGVEK